jgi:hypothetical protein
MIDDKTDGIISPAPAEEEVQTGFAYDILGRKLPSLQGEAGGRLPKGLYIINGKKYVK